ncbi:MAG: glycosyltransferase [Deltaproteobacteria bacterium]|nr:glycosyltransferase [Deltaproteobacteria bacterium]
MMGLFTYLAGRGHRNHLMCHPQGALAEAARRKGIETFPLSLRNELDLRPVFSLRRLIRREGYDIVHFHTKRAHALSLWLGRLRPGIRYVVTRRMDYPVRRNRYVDFLCRRHIAQDRRPAGGGRRPAGKDSPDSQRHRSRALSSATRGRTGPRPADGGNGCGIGREKGASLFA